ncbi:unnamed protein product [Closterium sp. NIES-54]
MVDGCFNRMYIRPSASRGALGFCRPVVALDGTFLISAQRATLLIAVVLDGNQKILMLAWALVEGENKDSWTWFLQNLLKSFPEWPHRQDASIISDCDKACRRDFEQMANYLLGIEKPISTPSPADASEQQRPAPTTATEARQQATDNRCQGREATHAAMGRATTSRAHGHGAGDASGPGATPAKPGPALTESALAPMAQPSKSPATNAPPSRPSGQVTYPATSGRTCHAQQDREATRAKVEMSTLGGNTCLALVVVTLDNPWPDVNSGNPQVNLVVDAEEDEEEEADAEEADAEAADEPATAEGNQVDADADADDNT